MEPVFKKKYSWLSYDQIFNFAVIKTIELKVQDGICFPIKCQELQFIESVWILILFYSAQNINWYTLSGMQLAICLRNLKMYIFFSQAILSL